MNVDIFLFLVKIYKFWHWLNLEHEVIVNQGSSYLADDDEGLMVR
jgi:hypothetical protein